MIGILVGGATTILKNMRSSSMGLGFFPTEWKVIKFHGSNAPSSIGISWDKEYDGNIFGLGM
jgi:hypothetical protein